MKTKKERIIRIILVILLFIVAINGFGGGYYGLAGAKDVPLEWLQGTPFRNYVIPALFILIFIGVVPPIAAIIILKKPVYTKRLSIIIGILLLLWIAVQVTMIGYVSWMRPATFITGLIILLLAFLLPERKKIVDDSNR